MRVFSPDRRHNQQVRMHPVLPRLADKVLELLVTEELAVPGGWESGLFYLRIREKLGQKAADMLRVMLVANPEDWADSPIWLSYGPTRPLRLLKRYGFRAFRCPGSSPTSRGVHDSQIASGSNAID